MSRKKIKKQTKRKSTPHGGFSSAERCTHGMPQTYAEDKISPKLEVLASQLLVHPASSNPVVVQMAVSLAQIAWNRANDNGKTVEKQDGDAELLGAVEMMIPLLSGACLKKELKETDIDLAIWRLVQYKQNHFADDHRRIVAVVILPDENPNSDFKVRIQAHWTKPDEEKMRQTADPADVEDLAKELENGVLSKKIVNQLTRFRQNKVVDLKSWKTGQLDAEKMQKEIFENKDLAALRWDHAIYMYVQHVMAHMSEQIVMLPQMSWFHDIMYRAEEEYTPSGPPMSPLTGTFFFCWSMFDLCKGASLETVGSVIASMAESLNVDPDMLRIQRLFHTSRMGLYEHFGVSGDEIKFRELFVNRELNARCSSGYKGRKGEIWYARILPPPYPEKDDTHVVFTTPYVMLDVSAADWEKCISYEIQRLKKSSRCTSYDTYMKYGPGFLYWPEYVFEAYVNHTPSMILLKGLPNQPESRPHSPAYKNKNKVGN